MSRDHLPSGLKTKDIALGTGPIAQRGSRVSIHFRCFLKRGDQVRSTYEDTAPTSFVVGKREVIAGLEYAVEGMRVGGRRQLLVSPHLAFRDAAVPGIPANAMLRFEVELLDVQKNC